MLRLTLGQFYPRTYSAMVEAGVPDGNFNMAMTQQLLSDHSLYRASPVSTVGDGQDLSSPPRRTL